MSKMADHENATNQVAVAPFEPWMCQIDSYGLNQAYGMPPGPPKNKNEIGCATPLGALGPPIFPHVGHRGVLRGSR